MPMDPEKIWIELFKKLPPDPTGKTSPKEIASLIDKRVTGKLSLKQTTIVPPPKFTYQKGLLEKALKIIVKIPAPTPIANNTIIAEGWKLSILASPLVVQSGAKMNPPPPGTNGIVSTAIATIDPPSVAAATSILIKDLTAAKPVSGVEDPEFPKAFYKAFNSLTYTINGIDTSPTPAGPFPIMLPVSPVV